MNKRHGAIGALLLGGIAMLAALYGWAAIGDRAPKRIYFVTIDTLRADHVGAYGYPRNTTPFIDSLASKSVVFEKAMSAAPHTAPSHASFFTGLFPFQHGVRRNEERLPEKIISLPSLLSLRGYETGAFPAVQFLDGKVGFPKSPYPLRTRRDRDWWMNASEVFDSALRWLGERDRSKPLLVWMHVYDVHQWQGRNQLPDSYTRETLQPGAAEMGEFLEKKHAIPPEFFGDRSKMVEAIDGYDLRLRFVDDQLRRLYDEITRLGLNEDALWVITSDHGEGLGNHGYEGHGQYLYQEQLHIPLLMHSTSEAFPAARVSGAVRSVDIFPTILSMVNEELERFTAGLEGQPFAEELLSGEWNEFSRFPVFAERRPKDGTSLRRDWIDGTVFAVQSGSEKLIEYSDGPDELYDLSADPFEQRNLETAPFEKPLRGELIEILKREIEGTAKEEEPALDETQLEQLRTLGYL